MKAAPIVAGAQLGETAVGRQSMKAALIVAGAQHG